MMRGKRIDLRAVEPEDLSQMREWRNRADFRRYFREYREINATTQERWYEREVLGNDKTLMFAVEETSTREMVGVCGLCYVNWVNRHADLSLYIGKGDVYIDTAAGGYAWDALDVLFEYGFNQLNLNKVWSEIYASDEKKHQLFARYGFSQEGIFREHHFIGGQYEDSHIFSILAREWRERRK
jgi:RimJ/RimL family protein N-acetyltransferase